jgi:hypothetical protein
MTTLVIVTLSFISLTAITFPTQQAQAFTSPICGPDTGTGIEPITATTVTYGGKKFDIIGYSKNGNEVGVAGPNNSVTLLLDRDETVTSGVAWYSASTNVYKDSTLSEVMDIFANSTLSTNTGIIERTLTGGSNTYATVPPGDYNEDWVAGPDVINQKVWPLSVDETSHLILSTRVYPGTWWLRTPGNRNEFIARLPANGNMSGKNGNSVSNPNSYRYALYLNISNTVFTGINFDNNNLSIGACTREPTNLGIDYTAETITGLDTATEGWKIAPTYAGLGAFEPQSSTSTSIDNIISNSAHSLVFVKAADDDDHFDSDRDRNNIVQQSLATTINIPVRPSAPSGLAGVAPSDVGLSDGKITGTSNKMEYNTTSANFAGSWTVVGGSAVTGLTSGTYYVRTIADQSVSKFKSFATTVIVAEGNSDRDGDGISDGDEVHGNACYIAPKDTSICYTTNPKSKDTDGDSIDDNVELKNGTDPTDPNDPGKNNRGSGPSAGTSEGTAQTGVDSTELELLLLLLLLLVIPSGTCCAILRYSEGSAGIRSR